MGFTSIVALFPALVLSLRNIQKHNWTSLVSAQTRTMTSALKAKMEYGGKQISVQLAAMLQRWVSQSFFLQDWWENVIVFSKEQWLGSWRVSGNHTTRRTKKERQNTKCDNWMFQWAGSGILSTILLGQFQFRLQVEPHQGDQDDSALNSICLICSDTNKTEICSTKGTKGNWGESTECLPGFDAALFQDQANHDETCFDDTAGNNLKLRCANSRMSSVSGIQFLDVGQWSSKLTTCACGKRICGISTRVVPPSGDYTALNGVRFKCC